MKRSILTIIAATLLASLSLAPMTLASVGGGGGGGSVTYSDAQVTRAIKMTISEIGPDNALTLVDSKTEQVFEIVLDDAVKLRAKSKKLFDGRKNLVAADLAEGQTVRVVIRADSGRILQMTVLSA